DESRNDDKAVASVSIGPAGPAVRIIAKSGADVARKSKKSYANLRHMHLYYRWRSRPDIAQLEHTVDQLRTELIKLRRQLSGKEQYIDRLKFLCHERMTRIDDQRGQIEQLRAANQKLDAEAEAYYQRLAAG